MASGGVFGIIAALRAVAPFAVKTGGKALAISATKWIVLNVGKSYKSDGGPPATHFFRHRDFLHLHTPGGGGVPFTSAIPAGNIDVLLGVLTPFELLVPGVNNGF